MARTPSPGEKSSEIEIDEFNRAMRGSKTYREFLASQGLVDSGQGVRMSKDQRKALMAKLTQAGIPLQKGMEIDEGGNLDTKGFNWKKWGPIIAAGVATGGLGLAGMGPAAGLQGLFGLGGAGGGAAGAAIPSLAAGIPSTAAQAFGPFAGGMTAAGTGGALAAGEGVRRGVKAATGGGFGGGSGLDWTKLGLGVAGSLFGGDDEPRPSRVAFPEGHSLNADVLGQQFNDMFNNVFKAHLDQANKGVNINTMPNPNVLPNFSGGGLPFPIGVTPGQVTPGTMPGANIPQLNLPGKGPGGATDQYGFLPFDPALLGQR